jgi:hypothetical protein
MTLRMTETGYPPEYAWSSEAARIFHKPRDFDEPGSLSACGNVTLWHFTTHREIVPSKLKPCPQRRCFGASSDTLTVTGEVGE